MGLTAGIIGLPNAGKSTIFNALTSGSAAAENYPFCTIEPNHGVTALPDERLETITRCITTGRVVPAFLELVDIAGLVKGASQGEGLGNQFLGHIREADALLVVLRCFEASDVVHVDGRVDAVKDAEIIGTELIIKDLETVERSYGRIAKAVQTGNKELAGKVELLGRLSDALQRGIPARQIINTGEERKQIADLHLLTVKPVLYLANTGDGVVTPAEQRQIDALTVHADTTGAQVLTLHGKIEAEIVQLSAEEREDYYQLLDLTESGLAVLTRALYRLLGLQTFFTVNEKELHAWPLAIGATALDAAATVHTDFAAGFVRADVYNVDDLSQHGTETALRSAGKIRSEGREYTVCDGDILFFKATP